MENTILKFEFTIEEANIILAGLQELPAKVCYPLTQKLQLQAKDQLPRAEETAQVMQ
jgi:hypothetical protein